LRELREKLEKCWCRETIWHKNTWNPNNPSKGQCYVTSILIQGIFDGKVFRGSVDDEEHYWNEFPDGTEIDLTSDQFDGGDGLYPHPRRSFLKVVIPNRRNKRYLILKEKYLGMTKGFGTTQRSNRWENRKWIKKSKKHIFTIKLVVGVQ
jgi:hypothetical protein